MPPASLALHPALRAAAATRPGVGDAALPALALRVEGAPCASSYWPDPYSDLCVLRALLTLASVCPAGYGTDALTGTCMRSDVLGAVLSRRAMLAPGASALPEVTTEIPVLWPLAAGPVWPLSAYGAGWGRNPEPFVRFEGFGGDFAPEGFGRDGRSVRHGGHLRGTSPGLGTPAVTVTQQGDGSCPPGYTPFPGTNQCLWTGPGSPPDPATGAGPGPAQGITVVAAAADGSCPAGYIPIPGTGTCSWDWGTYPGGPGGVGSPPSATGGAVNPGFNPIQQLPPGFGLPGSTPGGLVCDPGSTLIFGQCVSVFGSGLPVGTPPITTDNCPAGYISVGGQCLPAFIPPGGAIPPVGGYIPAPGGNGSIPQVLANIPPGLIPPGLLPPGTVPGLPGGLPAGLPGCPPGQIRSQGGLGPCFSPGGDIQPGGPGPVPVPPLPNCPPGSQPSVDGCIGISTDGCGSGRYRGDDGKCRIISGIRSPPTGTEKGNPATTPAKTNWLPIALAGGAVAAIAGVMIAAHKKGQLPSQHVLHHAGARRAFLARTTLRSRVRARVRAR